MKKATTREQAMNEQSPPHTHRHTHTALIIQSIYHPVSSYHSNLVRGPVARIRKELVPTRHVGRRHDGNGVRPGVGVRHGNLLVAFVLLRRHHCRRRRRLLWFVRDLVCDGCCGCCGCCGPQFFSRVTCKATNEAFLPLHVHIALRGATRHTTRLAKILTVPDVKSVCAHSCRPSHD
jgi:hypothetical protein